MNPTSNTPLNAHIHIDDVDRTDGRVPLDEVRISGDLTVATPFGYALHFQFRDMWIRNNPSGSRGVRAVLLHGEAVHPSTASFVSGLIVQMVVQDAELRKHIFPRTL